MQEAGQLEMNFRWIGWGELQERPPSRDGGGQSSRFFRRLGEDPPRRSNHRIHGQGAAGLTFRERPITSFPSQCRQPEIRPRCGGIQGS